jgi:hypothetical protein
MQKPRAVKVFSSGDIEASPLRKLWVATTKSSTRTTFKLLANVQSGTHDGRSGIVVPTVGKQIKFNELVEIRIL